MFRTLDYSEKIQRGDIYSLALIFYEIGQYKSDFAGEEGKNIFCSTVAGCISKRPTEGPQF